MAVKTGSVDPSKFPGEAFDLYSIQHSIEALPKSQLGLK